MGTVVLTTDTYRLTCVPRSRRDRVAKSRVYVADLLAEQSDEQLRKLSAQEADLGKLRWSQRGENADVDKLYDRLNRRIATVKRRMALDAVRKISGYANVNGNFSRNAGCSCGCSPGVILDREVHMTIDGYPHCVDLWLKAKSTDD